MQADWTEKYRPKSLAQIVGNELAVRALRRWGEAWQKGHPRTKAVTLRGEPGTGKTSAALALANDMGWDFIEMNASDHRNAAAIKKVAGIGAVSQTFTAEGEFLSAARGRRKLIILDEADNLFGREDSGGAKAIVETVRDSSQPIVIIVNDYYELTRKAPAIKTLSETVVFRRIDARYIVSVLKGIAKAEALEVPDELLMRIAENSGGDMRAAINDLQMISEGRSSLDGDASSALGKRNQQKEIHASLRAMFGANTLKDARDATLDLDETPEDLIKWIEENIPLEYRDPGEMAIAFDWLSRADVYLARTRRTQYYGLWSYAKELMTGGVALARERSQRPIIPEYRFPGHFILLSRARGPRAARESLAEKVHGYLHTSKRRLYESALPLLCTLLRNDRELLVKLAIELGLDEGDIAFVLGEDVDSSAVRRVLDEIASRPEPGGRHGGGTSRPRSARTSSNQ